MISTWLREGRCPGCGGPPARRRVLCASCLDAGLGWCPTCMVVESAGAFYAPAPSARRKGATYGPHRACRRYTPRYVTHVERVAARNRATLEYRKRRRRLAVRRARIAAALAAAGKRHATIAEMTGSSMRGVRSNLRDYGPRG